MRKLFKEGKISLPTNGGRIPMEPIPRNCMACGKEFMVKPWMTKKTCNDVCYRKLLSDRSKQLFKTRVENGTWTTWRKNTQPSYPEKYFMSVLDGAKISYEYEKPAGIYSIDFAINEKKIALEIDGKQHEFPERKISDNKKDIYLKSNGWTVYRIKWLGAKKTIPAIKEFLDFYNGAVPIAANGPDS